MTKPFFCAGCSQAMSRRFVNVFPVVHTLWKIFRLPGRRLFGLLSAGFYLALFERRGGVGGTRAAPPTRFWLCSPALPMHCHLLYEHPHAGGLLTKNQHSSLREVGYVGYVRWLEGKAMTRVIHMRDSKFGRVGGGDEVYIGRPGVWGNPFAVEKYGREGCIEKYEAWMEKRLDEELRAGKSDLRKAIAALEGKTLVCWCAPRRCHGEVLAHLAWCITHSD